MSLSKPVRRVAVVGTGVIGASWATLYLARGFDVTATDPAPNAEANLRRYVDTAWQPLATLGLSPKHRPGISLHRRPEPSVGGCRLRPGKRTRSTRAQDQVVLRNG